MIIFIMIYDLCLLNFYSAIMAGASLCPNAMSPKISTPAMYVFGIVICTLELPMAVFTVLGNCCVIYVIYRCPSLHRNHNYMLVTVAATDLITGLVTQPLYVTTILQEIKEDVNCDLKEALAAFNLLGNLTSLLALMMLSLERVLAVKLPFWYNTRVTPKRLLFLVVCGWVLALLLVLTPYLAAVAHKTRMRVGIVFQILSFVIIVIMSLFMYRMARRHENQIAAHLPVSVDGHWQIQQRERKALKTTVAVLGALVLCQIPMFTSSFLFRIKVFDEQDFAVALWPAGTLMHLNSSLNFCIYGWRNVDIREKIKELLCVRQNNEVAISSSLAPPPAPRTQSTSC